MTYWNRTLMLQQIALGVGIAVVTFAAAAIAVGGSQGFRAGAVLASIILVGFGLAARVRVKTTPSGVSVVNSSRTRSFSWDEVIGFSIREPERGRPWAVLLEARGHVPLGVDALRGPNIKPRGHEAWARGVVRELNEEIARRTCQRAGEREPPG